MKHRTTSPWYRRLSLRTRILLISALAVTAVLAIGGVLLLTFIRAELIDSADDAGSDAAESVGALAKTITLPPVLAPTEDIEAAVQVVKDGKVISSTQNAAGAPPFLKINQDPFELTVLDRKFLPFDEDGPFRVVAYGVETPTGRVNIFVAVDVEDVDEVMDVAGDIGLGGLVVLVALLAAVLWGVIGRALAPVKAIRERANDITGSKLHQRVPEPAAEDEIFALARTINEMLERLEDSAKRQEAFVADAAHELRSPITTLQARLETELHGSGPDTDDRLVRDLLHETIRMRRLVDHLLLLARSDAGTISSGTAPVDMEEVVRESVSAAETGPIPITTTHVEPVQVRGQPALLEHVVSNLLENAGRYAASSIDVSLQANGQYAILTVDDDGPGIPEHLRAGVLERFVRVDESRERGTGGAGLGLAIVAEIVRVHEGEIEITDSLSGGARVRVLLPLS